MDRDPFQVTPEPHSFHQLHHSSFPFPTLEQLCLLLGAKPNAKTPGKRAAERYWLCAGAEKKVAHSAYEDDWFSTGRGIAKSCLTSVSPHNLKLAKQHQEPRPSPEELRGAHVFTHTIISLHSEF